MRALFFRATTTRLFDFGVSVSDQHSTLPIRVASLFALGIWPSFLWLGKWLYILTFPNCVEVHAVGEGCFFVGWDKVIGSISHRCPDVSPRVQLSHHKARPQLFCSSALPFPPLLGRAKFFRAQSNLIARKNASRILPFGISLAFYHLHYLFWDLIDLFEGKDFKLFIPPFICSTQFIPLHQFKTFYILSLGSLKARTVSYSSFVYLLRLTQCLAQTTPSISPFLIAKRMSGW